MTPLKRPNSQTVVLRFTILLKSRQLKTTNWWLKLFWWSCGVLPSGPNELISIIYKLSYFSKFASHFIKSVRDTFGVEVDISTNEHFFIFTVSLYCDDMDFLLSIAHINICDLKLMFLADSFLIDDGNASKFNKLFVELFNSEAN